MKALVIYHAPHCNDGFTAAWVAYHGIMSLNKESTVLLYPMSYAPEADIELLEHLTIEDYDWIYVVDFSLRLEIIEGVLMLQSKLLGMTILDHHKSAFQMYAPDMEVTENSALRLMLHGPKVLIILKNNMSGAALAWCHWNSADFHPLVAHVQDRDLWRFQLEHTKAIHMYLGTKEYSLEVWDRIAEELDTGQGYANIVNIGNKLLRIYDEEVDIIANQAVPCTIKGKTGLMVECHGKYASDVGNTLAGACGTFGMTYSESEDGERLHCSLRSNNSYDVEVLAKQFGGGGHKNASGFKVSIEEMDSVFEEKYEIPEEVDHHNV